MQELVYWKVNQIRLYGRIKDLNGDNHTMGMYVILQSGQGRMKAHRGLEWGLVVRNQDKGIWHEVICQGMVTCRKMNSFGGA